MIDRDDLEGVGPLTGPLERITAGVRNLWNVVNGLDARVDRHDERIKWLMAEVLRLQEELKATRREIQGLKISKGKQKAKADRAIAAIDAAEKELNSARKKLGIQ